MRIGARRGIVLLAAIVFVGTAIGCGGAAGLFRQYEYEEEMYLSLDGSATMYVNASIAALNELRGTTFDAAPSARFDRDVFRRYFSTPVTHVTRISTSRRSGRRFVHVRLDVDDVRRLGEAAPFAWSTYRFDRAGDRYTFTQTVDGRLARQSPSEPARTGASEHDAANAVHADRSAPARYGWTGRELVAFRLHVPSKIDFHNTQREIGRGNILAWEQSLSDRLAGTPLVLEARMETQSILYRTLWLFGLTLVLAALTFVGIIWWVVRRGSPSSPGPAESA
jgi:hypothetical protein